MFILMFLDRLTFHINFHDICQVFLVIIKLRIKRNQTSITSRNAVRI